MERATAELLMMDRSAYCWKAYHRDVIAFPKVQNASDLMTNAPRKDTKQLMELHIQ